ncbi:hypothetical protein ACFOG5_12335 [Pedobacter fastidiosus]|uniref:Addiction module component n=1 Tax=Pedobacter fastidiosus TaxID=2765361 RepID=A0ABR7KM74_9SPHI|nr:hypothetical protein [Pedobacter fastidiosus]MBC6109170.1 hypothetical protein [Pedobacter fastidiosus]
MDLQAEKLNVINTIINSDDLSLIKDIKAIISNRELDWFDGLTKKQQDDVLEGIKQLDHDDHFSHEDAKKRFNF